LSNFASEFLHKCLRAARLGQRCLLCGATDADSVFCAGCREDLPWLTPSRCPVCALPAPDSRVCGECLKRPPKFDRTLAVFSYGFPTDALIQAMKYEHKLEIAGALGAELSSAVGDAPLPDALIPVPLSPARLLKRGFNQSLEIAKVIKKQHRLRMPAEAAQRIKETPPQVLLPWKERAKNIRGAFACESDFSFQHVALVDDVMTTGATLNELARVVKKAGAREVSCWVVARTLRQV
jgi:ComF family protein